MYFLLFKIFEQLALALKIFKPGGAAASPDSYAYGSIYGPCWLRYFKIGIIRAIITQMLQIYFNNSNNIIKYILHQPHCPHHMATRIIQK